MRLTPVVKNLLILNVLFFVAVFINEGTGNGFDLKSFLSLHYPTSEQFRPFQLVTHFFMHADFMHIAFNMFALAMFGPPVEMQWGPQRFLLFYILCAFGSAGLHLGYTSWELGQMSEQIAAFGANADLSVFNSYFSGVPQSLPMTGGGTLGGVLTEVNTAFGDGNVAYAVSEGQSIMNEWYKFKENIPMLGASGAVFGVLIAFGMKFPDTKLALLFFPVPVKARYFIPGIIALELFLGMQRYSWDNMAHFAHLGGALIGFLLVLYFRRSDPPSIQRWDRRA